MEGISAALADELLDTVIHKFQIPGSGTQLKVQATAITELMKLLEEHSSVKFADATYQLVNIVRNEMPACYGAVPNVFYQLRHEIEGALSQDELLKHVVNISAVRGTQNDLYTTIPVLKNPDIPEEFKEEMMDGSISLVIDTEILESAATIIDRLCGDDKEKIKIYIATGAQAANAGDELKDATKSKDWEKLRHAQLDLYGMMEASSRVDVVMDRLFRHYRSKLYEH